MTDALAAAIARIFVTCGRRGASVAISVVDPGFVVDLVDWDTPNQPHNPDPPR
jgi:hypothetical protein